MSELEETHDWAKKVADEFKTMSATEGADDVKALDNELTNGGDHHVNTIQFVHVDRDAYRTEIGKVEDDLMFHFYPSPDPLYSIASIVETTDEEGNVSKETRYDFKELFPSALASAFLAVFKQEEKLCWDYVPELISWVVRCKGFGNNVMKNKLAEKLLDSLDSQLVSDLPTQD